MNLNLPAASVPSPKGDEIPFTPNTQLAKVAFGLALLTFFIYLPVIGYTFVNYDDDVFVTYNKMVAPGFTWEGVKWAFTSAEIDYWRPLSWLSHMLDMELFGLVGGMHHLTNLLIHIASSIMLLIALNKLTQSLWRSAIVTALFAWHPLHVESVAWVAERKDVLCGFFWFFTFWAYARYVEKPVGTRYFLVLLGFVLGVMSKPMIVTLPCVLLLLDFWPLRRVNPAQLAFWKNPDWRAECSRLWTVIKEKLPLFAIVLALSLSTITAQREVGTMSENIPLFARMATASVSYVTYLRQTFWPTGLCVLYPLEAHFAPWRWAGAALLCAGITARSLALAHRFPYLPVGCFWFFGTLVPVIGLVQVGEQAHADRYTYLPLVGVFLLLVWLAADLIERRGWLRSRLGNILLVSLILGACAVTTRRQLRYWEDSISLFNRVIEVNPRATTGYNNVAAELMSIGRPAEAIPYLERVLSIAPTHEAYFNLSGACFALGDYSRASVMLSKSVEMTTKARAEHAINEARTFKIPEAKRGRLHYMLATAWATRKEYTQAVAELREALKFEPSDSSVRNDMAVYLAASGNDAEALLCLQESVRLNPTNELAQSNLGGLLARKGRLDEALQHYQVSLKLRPDNPDTRHNYAMALARSNRPLDAKAEFEEVLRRKPDHLPAIQQLTWLLATRPECLDASKALLLAKSLLAIPPTPLTLDAVGAAAAANGDFATAAQLAAQAITMARDAKLNVLEDEIRARLQLYKAGKPFYQAATQPVKK
ncbi:MAG: hypothetical protein EBS05_01660 [Proteobacteria bacterium]|nr:hypothetical protein [Pseudomonadota bacterium]